MEKPKRQVAKKTSGWEAWRGLITTRIEGLASAQERSNWIMDDQYQAVIKELNGIKVEIGKLKVKSGTWGILGGMVPFLIAVCVWLLDKLK